MHGDWFSTRTRSSLCAQEVLTANELLRDARERLAIFVAIGRTQDPVGRLAIRGPRFSDTNSNN